MSCRAQCDMTRLIKDSSISAMLSGLYPKYFPAPICHFITTDLSNAPDFYTLPLKQQEILLHYF